jgi:hypothetical protein
MRWRNSARSASGKVIRNGRIASLSCACEVRCCVATDDAAGVRVFRPRVDVTFPVVSISSTVFISISLVWSFRFCRICFRNFRLVRAASSKLCPHRQKREFHQEWPIRNKKPAPRFGNRDRGTKEERAKLSRVGCDRSSGRGATFN